LLFIFIFYYTETELLLLLTLKEVFKFLRREIMAEVTVRKTVLAYVGEHVGRQC